MAAREKGASDVNHLLVGTGLTKRYGGVLAVTDVDIHVGEGEVLGLVGPNGAGKTTLVDLICGTQSSDSGNLTLDGRTLSGPPSRRARAGLARTYQHPLLAHSLTVRENLIVGMGGVRLRSVGSMITGLIGGVIKGVDAYSLDRAEQLAAEVGLTDLDRLAGDLSLGEQRLVEVARALGQDPRVMLLDEPFAGADSHGIAGIAEVIATIRNRGHGVILIDHNVDIVSEIVDRMMLMQMGKAVFDGNPAECIASEQMKLVYFGEDE